MNTPDDLDAYLEDSLGPVPPPAGLRDRLLARVAPTPAPSRRVLAFAAPLVAYALGVLTMVVLPRRAEPDARPPRTGVSFDSIADQPPIAVPEAPPEAPAETVVEEPLPRIS